MNFQANRRRCCVLLLLFAVLLLSACHLILGALGAEASDWHNHCAPPKCDTQRCWCKVCGRWC